MTFFSMRTRNKLWTYGAAGAIVLSAVLIQTTILSRFPVRGPLLWVTANIPVYCNLPLTLAIVWGTVFGSSLPAITADELRTQSAGQIFWRQAASGSPGGLLLGAFLGALYAPMLSTYPFYLPLAGWLSGYFCLRHMNLQRFLCIPVVFVITLIAETVMALQLAIAGRPGVYDNLMQIAVHEAALNAIIAPFIYMPLRLWYDFSYSAQVVPEK